MHNQCLLACLFGCVNFWLCLDDDGGDHDPVSLHADIMLFPHTHSTLITIAFPHDALQSRTRPRRCARSSTRWADQSFPLLDLAIIEAHTCTHSHSHYLLMHDFLSVPTNVFRSVSYKTRCEGSCSSTGLASWACLC
jgi:hypothetical protein